VFFYIYLSDISVWSCQVFYREYYLRGSPGIYSRPTAIFFIYVDDKTAVVKNKLLLYADGSAILMSARNKSDIENELSNDLNNVSQWLVNN